MKIIHAIIKTGLFTPLIVSGSLAVFSLLFNDAVTLNLFEVIVSLLFSALVIGLSTILVFVPVAVINKNKTWSLMDWGRNVLPVALIPLVVIAVSICCCKPSLYAEAEFLIVFLQCLIGYYVSFLIFFNSLSTKKS